MIEYENADIILGTVCKSTIKRHYVMMEKYLNITILEVTTFFSTILNLVSLDDLPFPDETDLDTFTQQVRLIEKALEKAGTPGTGKIKPVRIIQRTYIYMILKARNPIQIPMNLLVCRILLHDTS